MVLALELKMVNFVTRTIILYCSAITLETFCLAQQHICNQMKNATLIPIQENVNRKSIKLKEKQECVKKEIPFR